MKKERFKVVPAVYILFRNDNKALLLKRHNTGYRDGEYSLPSGHVDGGEPANVAASRESKEEVGVHVDPNDFKLLHTSHRLAEAEDNERIDLFFEAEKWRGEFINAEPQKCSELRWAEIDNLPSNIVPELKRFLNI